MGVQGASQAEKKRWLQVVQSYMRQLAQENEEAYLIPVGKVREGHESRAFLKAVKA